MLKGLLSLARSPAGRVVVAAHTAARVAPEVPQAKAAVAPLMARRALHVASRQHARMAPLPIVTLRALHVERQRALARVAPFVARRELATHTPAIARVISPGNIFRLPEGIDDYREAVQQEYTVVDKTLFVRDILNETAKSLLITRPRGFGKTMAMSMLNYFLTNQDAEANRELFRGTLVEDAVTARGESCMEYQGKYPTVFITMKDIRSPNFEHFQTLLASEMSDAYLRHRYLLTSEALLEEDREFFSRVLKCKASFGNLQHSLFNLTKYLSKHHQKPVILLVDEYDTPFHEAYVSKDGPYHEDVINFMKVFLGAAFKGNPHLAKGVMTGIVEIALVDSLSGVEINNIITRSIKSGEYAQYFGFTEEELTEYLKHYGAELDIEQIREWYNGYEIGGTVIYNPWSVIRCLYRRGQIGAYSVGSGERNLIGRALLNSSEDVHTKLLALLQGESIEVVLSGRTMFSDLDRNPDALWETMLSRGYLKLVFSRWDGRRIKYSLKIPNKEIMLAYKDMVQNWFASIGSGSYRELFDSIDRGNIDRFRDILQEYLDQSESSFDAGPNTPKKVYHMLVFGMLFVLRDRYFVSSNLESGKGRPDVILIPKKVKGKHGVIFEFKKTKNKEHLDRDVDIALDQINRNRYQARLEKHDVTHAIHVGVAFHGRELRVRHEEHDYGAKVVTQSTSPQFFKPTAEATEQSPPDADNVVDGPKA